ncbi:MAG: tetratricopeptide repeat protein [Phycisphaerales bacterium]|jgi:tetratricopeptide (TPR) repeat protein|nr:tetratricopeptide repeat protein [Phycisphaerales bacterium]
MLRRWMMGVAVCVLGSALWADQGVVTLKDGHKMEGDVTEKEDMVIVTIRGIQTQLKRADVQSISYIESLDKEYQQRLEKLDPKDVQGRLQLARWAFDNHRYDLARDAVEKALAIDPNNEEATTFLELIRRQSAMERNQGQENTRPTPSENTGGQGVRPPAPSAERRVLTADNVNTIRQFELRPTDTNVRVRFENDVKRRFVAAYNQDQNYFNNLQPVDQAIEILNQADEKFTRDVRILSDPQSMLEFRRFVQPMVLQNCATSACHGGSAGGKLVLFNNGEATDTVAYTNFYILQNYAKTLSAPGSSFGSGPTQRKLIDRTQPEMSLLAQYGLQPDKSDLDHPQVAGYRPIFRSRDDARYKQLITWMRDSLRPVEPNYGIDYTPPGMAATTQPTSAPSP